MDEIDHRLIALLRTDGRAPMAELARAVRLSRGAVQNRIDRMIARGDISGFTVKTPNGAEMGIRAIVGVAIEGDAGAAVMRALKGLPAVEAVHMTNGRWDMIAELRTDTLAGFSLALDSLRLIEGIASSETSLLLKSYQF